MSTGNGAPPVRHTPASHLPEPELRRTIHLGGAVALVVGAVVGAGIFALIGKIALQAGNALWLAFSIAITVSLVGVIPLLQIASALPRAGAGYFFCSRLLSPVWGALTSYWVILGGAASTCVVAVAMADYSPLPLSAHAGGAVLVLAFFGVYLFGLRLAMGIQVVMAAQFILALLIYAAAGYAHSGAQFAVHSPAGPSGLMTAVILCYSTCMGFQVVAEMGEEMHHPRRNIPLALILGGGLVAVIYILVGTVFTTSIPYDRALYETMQAPLNKSAEQFLPGPLVSFLSLGAITAGLTSFNAAAVALPRELFAQARDGLAPLLLAHVDRRTHTPLAAVTAYFLFVIAMLGLGMDTDFYGIMAAVGIQVMSAVLCIASLRLKRLYPEHHAAAYIRVPQWLLVLCTIVTVLASAGFIALIAGERPSVMAFYAAWTAAVLLYYALRVRWLRREGYAWDARVHTIPVLDFDEAA